MISHSVTLSYTPGCPGVVLRELCGADELSFPDTSTRSVLILLDRIMEDKCVVTAAQLVTADRDHLLASIYTRLYGDKIESTISCRHCEMQFDMDFSLQQLQSHLREQPKREHMSMEQPGIYRLDVACSFRLPTGEDEMAIENFAPDEASEQLLKRCLLTGDPLLHGVDVQEAMAAVAPVLQTDISAGCPECGQTQMMLFDMQSFLMGRLLNERRQVMYEIHRLARTYRWSHAEILSLSRVLRRTYYNLIESEMY